MKKKPISFLIIILIFSVTTILCAFATFRQENGRGHANVVSAQTPTESEHGTALWMRSFAASTGTFSHNSDPIIHGDVLYIANDTTLYELAKKDGTILRTFTLSANTNSTCHLLLEESHLFVPLNGGMIECISINSMTSEWTSEAFGGQSLSTLFYHDGYLYAGNAVITSVNTCTGIFYCLNTATGATQWTYEDKEHPGGYYWSGAIVCKNRLFFTGDNGILVSHSLTGEEVYETYPLSDVRIRSGLTYEDGTSSLYTASMDAKVYRIPLSEEGTIQASQIQAGSLAPSASYCNCTSTPTICQGRLYAGCFADGFGRLTVLDAEDLSFLYTVKGEAYAEIKSSPLVSTGYATEENHGRVYVYVSANNPPGGIYFLQDDTTCTSGTLQTLYIPDTKKQYCLASIACDDEGTLYYSNDSNTLFAVIEGGPSSDANHAPTDTPSPSPLPSAMAPAVIPSATDAAEKPITTSTAPPPSPTKTNSSQTASSTKANPKKPYQIHYTTKKKKVVLTWKKRNSSLQTILYVRYGKGKWQKKAFKKKTKYSIIRKKKTLRFRLRTRIRSKSKWQYSKYTKTYKVKGL